MKRLVRTLIICEKPDAARKLAEALTDERLSSLKKYGLTYFELIKDDDTILVCPALGHLYTVDETEKSSRRTYPVWKFVWKPKYQVEKGCKYQKEWINAIYELAKSADSFINGCDYDLEGSLIGYMILKYACNGADLKAGRMRYSTLTSTDLKRAYLNISPNLDYNFIHAGMIRHEIDWLYGVNLSRALTESARGYSKRYTIISTGRVQGPTLNSIVEREIGILTHVPIPYWTIDAEIDFQGQLLNAEYSKQRINTKNMAETIVEDVVNKNGKVEDIQEQRIKIQPPTPFDLSEIQAEAYRHYRINPSQTLKILERLYLDTLISYPRTSSQKLPASINYRLIIESLQKNHKYTELVLRLLSQTTLKPVEGKKTDPAHPAIYPTGQLPVKELEPRVAHILDLVIKRFMATFAPSAIKISQKATVKGAGEHIFHVQGSKLTNEGWIPFYQPYFRFAEISLPALRKGQEGLFKKITSREHHTKPPPRYNPSSLLRMMEENDIGTKTTRSGIIDILYKRGYIVGDAIKPTLLGIKVTETLRKYCPKIVDLSFIRELEVKMNNIELGKDKHESVVLKTIKELKSIMAELKENEESLGRDLSDAIKEMYLDKVTLTSRCPNCSLPLRIIKSTKTKKRFIGCSGKQTDKCNFTLPLPQFGRLVLLSKFCKKCGFQLIMAKDLNKKPLISCSKCYVKDLKEKSK